MRRLRCGLRCLGLPLQRLLVALLGELALAHLAGALRRRVDVVLKVSEHLVDLGGVCHSEHQMVAPLDIDEVVLDGGFCEPLADDLPQGRVVGELLELREVQSCVLANTLALGFR